MDSTTEQTIQWPKDAVGRRDWYAVERLSRGLQKDDQQRAFNEIDLINMGLK